MGSPGSESPRSMRDSHKVRLIFLLDWFQSIKRYKSKLDQRLGLCIFSCLTTIACILAIYGVMHKSVNDELVIYVNRTHQIAKELKHAMDENYPSNNESSIDQNGRRWMTVEELEYDAKLIRETNATIWNLFWWDFVLALLLAPVLLLVHCDVVEGNLAKLLYRGIVGALLLFCVAQLLYLIHPVLWGAALFPSMVDRLFLYGYPRDEYQINSLQERFACEFRPHKVLVQFDLQSALPEAEQLRTATEIRPEVSGTVITFIV
ncbi:unnamed protein product [Angiostrongylus costaricensis]|uniref:Chloride channel CLIC-like protein 1 n=1 Tax=Angiostrongylus costaricensis TaxID=334426 RepID=A0A158PHV0_ANGCS|nr:unnamed protein product [Angiostrongylus costaricensis]